MVLKKYQEKFLKTNFSSEGKLNLRWLRNWVFSFIISALLITITILLSDWGSISYGLAYGITCVSMLLQLVIIGQFGLRQSNIFLEQKYYEITKETQNNSSDKYAHSGLSLEKVQHLQEKLLKLMETEKPYLDNELTLPQLADKLEIPIYQLSQLINERLELSFFDFINQVKQNK